MLYSVPFDKFSITSTYTPLTVIFVLYYIIILENESSWNYSKLGRLHFHQYRQALNTSAPPEGKRFQKKQPLDDGSLAKCLIKRDKKFSWS